MKTRIIGILAVLVLIVATFLFFKMYQNSKGESNIKRNATEVEDKSIKEIDTDALSLETVDFKESNFDFDNETIIELEDNSIKVNGSNVKVDGNTIFITGAGAYRVKGTLSNGRIIVNAPKEYVKIILDNANITCDNSSPIYVYKSKTTVIYLADDSENYLTDGVAYSYVDEYSIEEDEEPNATLYSKSDLVIMGSGSLNIKGNFNNGITSKDTLYIKGATINVESKNNGINGKDSNTIENAVIAVVSGGDAIRSTNDKDTSLGWINISNSTIKITSEEDGIQAETDLVIKDSTLDIKTGGGSSSSKKVNNEMFGRDMWGKGSSSTSDETSMKAIKAGRYILIDEDVINIDSADDAIHSNASLEIRSGTFNIKTGDDGIHADDTVTIDGGTINVEESYEGIEGNNIVINDGIIDVVSSDDGINVNGGNDKSGFGGFGNFGGKTNVQDKNTSETSNKTIDAESINLVTTKSGMNRGERPEGRSFNGNKPSGDFMNRPSDFGDNPSQKPSGDFSGRMPKGDFDENMTPPDMSNENNNTDSSYKLIINGGTITIHANGDGLDSNGSIEMNGGNLLVQGPTSSMNGAIDYENSFTLNGGTILAIGASGMAQGVKSDSQASLIVTLQDNQSENTKIEIKDESGNVILETTSEKSFNNIVATSKDMEVDKTYSIYINGNLSSEATATLNSASKGFGGFGGMRNK